MSDRDDNTTLAREEKFVRKVVRERWLVLKRLATLLAEKRALTAAQVRAIVGEL